jgi:hypothetical protein
MQIIILLVSFIIVCASPAAYTDWATLIPLPYREPRYYIPHFSLVKDASTNRPSEMICSTFLVHQPFFNQFKFLLNGIFELFLKNFTVPDIPGHIPLTYVPFVGNLFLDITEFRIVNLELKLPNTTFTLFDDKLVLRANNVLVNVFTEFAVTKENNDTWLQGTVESAFFENL